MPIVDEATGRNETTPEANDQRQVVERLIAGKKKTSNKQEIEKFTNEWTKLANQSGLTNDTVSLLIEGFSIAGAAPLLAFSDNGDSCLRTLKTLGALPVVKENLMGASLRLYVHLFSLSVNAGKDWDCINTIVSAIPNYAYSREGKLYERYSGIPNYLLRTLDAKKAGSALKPLHLAEPTAKSLSSIFAPFFIAAVSKEKPNKKEIASVKVLQEWLEASLPEPAKHLAPDKEQQSSAAPDSAKSNATEENAERRSPETADDQNKTACDERAHLPAGSSHDSAAESIRQLERDNAETESKLAAANSAIASKDETIANSKRALDRANAQIDVLRKSNGERLDQIETAKRDINSLRRELEDLKSTADARAKMISMLEKSGSQKGDEALARIASKLKADYGDFREYKDEPMTVELGEIARLQLGQVFETLKSIGVNL